MIFILGVIIGILLILSLLVLELRHRMTYRPSKFIETIERSANRKQKGEVIIPLDEVTQAREKMIKEKHDAGLDVYLDDIP